MQQPLSVGGITYKRGIGTHATSTAMFVNESHSRLRFQASVGVDDAAKDAGTVVFQIYGDGTPLFDSGLIRRGDKARPVDIDLTGKRMIELRVTDGGDGVKNDLAGWCDARFIHEGAPPKLRPRWVGELSHYQGPALGKPSSGTTLGSPNGKVHARAGISEGRLVIEVKRGNTVVLEPSPIGMLVLPLRGAW